jgi:hypothetical protein
MSSLQNQGYYLYKFGKNVPYTPQNSLFAQIIPHKAAPELKYCLL